MSAFHLLVVWPSQISIETGRVIAVIIEMRFVEFHRCVNIEATGSKPAVAIAIPTPVDMEIGVTLLHIVRVRRSTR